MSQAIELPQGSFRAPRVPFDVKSLLLATFGFGVLRLANLALAGLFDERNPMGQLVMAVGALIGRISFLGEGFRLSMGPVWGFPAGFTLSWWQAALTALVFLVAWGVLAGAILRIAALRLTRDEPVSLRESLAYGGRNLTAFLLAPVLVVLFAGVFALLNLLAGAVIAIPVLGSWLLVLVLFPLVLISSLLVILSLLAGLFGLPLMWAGIAVEGNGALEALSRAFSYVFARPFQFLFGYLLLFILMSVVLLVGSFFEATAKETVRAGVWRGELRNVIAGEEITHRDVAPEETWDQDYQRGRRVRERGIGHFDNVGRARWYDWVGAFWMWAMLGLFLLFFKGYALYLFLGGTVSIYLQLRHDVDGTDEEEIHVPGEEEPPPPSGEEPRWVGSQGEEESPLPPDREPPEGSRTPEPETPQEPPADERVVPPEEGDEEKRE